MKNELFHRYPRASFGSRLTKFIAAGALFAVMHSPAQLRAQSASTQFVAFPTFVAATQSAQAGAFVSRPGYAVATAADFEEMRQHILSLYQGVTVQHTFLQDDHHFDCIPVAQQPSVRLQGLNGIAQEPPLSLIARNGQPASDAKTISLTSQLSSPRQLDQFGNAMTCEAGTIPMRRITLGDVARFSTLRQFLSKSPDAAADGVPAGAAMPGSTAHKYSYTYQYVSNLGGNSSLNLWRPYVNTGLGEVFSLSQQWYVGGSGSATQTAEVGWQNYPSKYGSENSALFIYWTRDNYATTGCYNLDCAAFVQTSSSWHFGAGFTNYSAAGGSQYEFAAQFYLYAGNWWLALGGGWVGYYPGSVYAGGQMSHNATLIEYGTESVGSTWYPPEGSGYWSSSGWDYAAYQRNLFYINTSAVSVWDTLTRAQPSPACYSITGPSYSSTSGWGIYFYEGGPGGSGC
ncbi:MAG TPA: neprosin family prolyl endopeptidase [Bryobacteraceae bacterium]|nr:neprosin family prolyl endopeptidase [Bryobacteraceae bacterium]